MPTATATNLVQDGKPGSRTRAPLLSLHIFRPLTCRRRPRGTALGANARSHRALAAPKGLKRAGVMSMTRSGRRFILWPLSKGRPSGVVEG